MIKKHLSINGRVITDEGPGAKLAVFLATVQTKEQAAAILETSEYNRKLRKGHIAHLKRMLEEGRWSDGVANISFDWKGHLINGHHTLNALLIMDAAKFKPVIVTVLVGLPPDAYGKSNNVTKTTSVDLLGAEGFNLNQNDISAAGRLLYSYIHGILADSVHIKSGKSFTPIHPEDVVSCVKDHPGLQDNLFVPAFIRKSRLSNSAYYVSHYLIIRDNPIKGPKFFTQLEEGLGYSAGSPVRALREKIINISRDEDIRGGLAVAWIFKAWNAFARGESMERLVFKRATKVDGALKGGEEFPVLEVGY